MYFQLVQLLVALSDTAFWTSYVVHLGPNCYFNIINIPPISWMHVLHWNYHENDSCVKNIMNASGTVPCTLKK
jgi:hypothetical protein